MTTYLLDANTLYEVLRGLIRRDATGQLQFLSELSTVLSWDELRRADWETAASLWAECSARHLSPDDGDPVIAAHAKRHRAIVVTSNKKHFLPLGVPIENWRKP